MTNTNTPSTAERNPASKNARQTRGRQFQPGNKFGQGRKVGSRNSATLMLEKMMADDAEDVVRAIVKAAKDGDMQAARMIVDRLIPVRKGRPVTINLPPFTTAAGVLEAIDVVTHAVAVGELTPEEASTIAGLLETKRRAIETMDLEERLAALEELTGKE